MPMKRTPKQWVEEVNASSLPHGAVAVWFIGQESVIMKGTQTIVYVDPYVSDHLENAAGIQRAYPAPFPPETITNADVCLITHEHADHLDEGTIRAMAQNSPHTAYVAPACCRQQLLGCGVPEERITDAIVGERYTFGEISVQPVAAAHEEMEFDSQGRHKYVGYLLEINGVKVYHAGDTVMYPELVDTLSEQKIDLGLLPINGGDFFRRSNNLAGNMDYREAAELAVAAGMDTAVPLHYDVFAFNSEKPGHFVQYLYENYPEQKFHVMARFERYIYVSDKAFR
ncbi:MBL fold metallo-hydrolase [Paenibacillus abyssi]|uniref:MBL fold metallo-hydrolase n=2 Tax=Paenibacillus abyssi TaxID=1340531 RepID=A0A917LH62_9BACL|nr:MBL fold metallo-hydrolase [Paenibacillus abyssi]